MEDGLGKFKRTTPKIESAVAKNQRREGLFLYTTHATMAVQIGTEPMSTTVPTATPTFCIPKKKNNCAPRRKKEHLIREGFFASDQFFLFIRR